MDVATALRVLDLGGGDGEPPASRAALRRAYHRTLVRHHPDKLVPPSLDNGDGAHPGRSETTTTSIDAIRAAYDRLLADLLDPTGGERRAGLAAVAAAAAHAAVDLSLFSRIGGSGGDDDDDAGWHLPCRCGADYRITQPDLEAGRDVVACSGCSLRVRVLYEEEDGEDAEEEDGDDSDAEAPATGEDGDGVRSVEQADSDSGARAHRDTTASGVA